MAAKKAAVETVTGFDGTGRTITAPAQPGRLCVLTPDQDAAMQALRARHADWGLCTDPADRTTAEAAFAAMYARLGKPAPRVVWVAGPAAGVFLLALPRKDGATASLGASLWASLWDSLGASLRDSLGASLRDSLRDSLWDSLGASLWDSLGASLRDSLRDSLWDSLRDSLWDSLRDSLWGQWEWWLAWYAAAVELGLKRDERWDEVLGWWQAIASSCGWWWARDGVVIACERPAEIHVEPAANGRFRLHRADGPALVMRDGWTVHAWHGQRVPAWVIEDDLTPQRVLAEPNAEVRRAAIERLGWDRLADAMTVIASDDWGTLYDPPAAVIGDDVRARVVVVTNGTPEPDGHRRRYGLLCDAACRTPLEAVARSYGMDPAEYARLERRT